MQAPCEIIVSYVLPRIRVELTKELHKKGLNQREIAEKLDITQPAVSQYLKQKRGDRVKLGSKTRKKVEKLANQIEEGAGPFAVLKGVCEICKEMKANKSVCKIHAQIEEMPEECKICLGD